MRSVLYKGSGLKEGDGLGCLRRIVSGNLGDEADGREDREADISPFNTAEQLAILKLENEDEEYFIDDCNDN